jgi:hypothetical protein
MRLLISGSRNFKDYTFFREQILKHYHDPSRSNGSHRISCIISGGAEGVDQMAEMFAEEFGIPIEVYPADWNTYGKSAGPIRNQQMLGQRIGEVVCFMGPHSRGTRHMMKISIENGKPTKLIRVPV